MLPNDSTSSDHAGLLSWLVQYRSSCKLFLRYFVCAEYCERKPQNFWDFGIEILKCRNTQSERVAGKLKSTSGSSAMSRNTQGGQLIINLRHSLRARLNGNKYFVRSTVEASIQAGGQCSWGCGRCEAGSSNWFSAGFDNAVIQISNLEMPFLANFIDKKFAENGVLHSVQKIPACGSPKFAKLWLVN